MNSLDSTTTISTESTSEPSDIQVWSVPKSMPSMEQQITLLKFSSMLLKATIINAGCKKIRHSQWSMLMIALMPLCNSSKLIKPYSNVLATTCAVSASLQKNLWEKFKDLFQTLRLTMNHVKEEVLSLQDGHNPWTISTPEQTGDGAMTYLLISYARRF